MENELRRKIEQFWNNPAFTSEEMWKARTKYWNKARSVNSSLETEIHKIGMYLIDQMAEQITSYRTALRI